MAGPARFTRGNESGRRRVAVVVLVVLGLIAAGCGDAKPSSTAAAKPAPRSSTSTTRPSPGKRLRDELGPGAPECLALGRRRVPKTNLNLDPRVEAASNRLAPLPLTLPTREIASIESYRTASDFVNTNAMILHPRARIAAMKRDRFTDGVEVDYQSGIQTYGVIVLGFETAAGAIDNYRVHLNDLCALAIRSSGLSGIMGVSYLRADGEAKAVFVVGTAEISLYVECGPVWSRVALAAQWAQAVSHQLAEGDDSEQAA